VNSHPVVLFVNYACTIYITQQFVRLGEPLIAIYLRASREIDHNYLAMKTMDAQRLCLKKKTLARSPYSCKQSRCVVCLCRKQTWKVVLQLH